MTENSYLLRVLENTSLSCQLCQRWGQACVIALLVAGVAPGSPELGECLHELGPVVGADPVTRHSLGTGDEPTERRVRLGRVGEELELGGRREAGQIADRPPPREERAKPAVGEDALDEVLADPRIVETSFFLDGKIGAAAEERVGEEATPVPWRHTLPVAHSHRLQAAGGRIFLQ